MSLMLFAEEVLIAWCICSMDTQFGTFLGVGAAFSSEDVSIQQGKVSINSKDRGPVLQHGGEGKQ